MHLKPKIYWLAESYTEVWFLVQFFKWRKTTDILQDNSLYTDQLLLFSSSYASKLHNHNTPLKSTPLPKKYAAQMASGVGGCCPATGYNCLVGAGVWDGNGQLCPCIVDPGGYLAPQWVQLEGVVPQL